MQSVVGLGGSAGSIRALQTFFFRMAGDSGLAFVVVLHLSPQYESSLAALLQKSTPMLVTQVSEAVNIEANCVYVIPPGKHLLRMCCNFVVEPKVGVDDRKLSSSQRTDRE